MPQLKPISLLDSLFVIVRFFNCLKYLMLSLDLQIPIFRWPYSRYVPSRAGSVFWWHFLPYRDIHALNLLLLVLIDYRLGAGPWSFLELSEQKKDYKVIRLYFTCFMCGRLRKLFVILSTCFKCTKSKFILSHGFATVLGFFCTLWGFWVNVLSFSSKFQSISLSGGTFNNMKQAL